MAEEARARKLPGLNPRESGAKILRNMLDEESLIAAGCFDTLSGKLAELAGFKVLHITGFGVEASLLGSPDMGLITLTELSEHVAHIAAAVKAPIICDVDTGFGAIESVFRTVQHMERIGVAAIHIEDVTQPKRNPFLDGRRLLPMQESVGRIRAACDARSNSDFMIIARSDADEISFDELVRRCNAYLKAGADMAMPVLAKYDGTFVHTLPIDQQLSIHRKLLDRIEGPVLGMAVPTGLRPLDMIDLGYKIMILPVVSIVPAASAMLASLRKAAVENELSTHRDQDIPMNNALDIMKLLNLDNYISRQGEYLSLDS